MKERRPKPLHPVFLVVGILVVAVAVLLSVARSRFTPASAPSNMVVHVSQFVWPPAMVEPAHVPFEGVEPAERINREMMRRYQKKWDHGRGSQFPVTPSLYPSPTESVEHRR